MKNGKLLMLGSVLTLAISQNGFCAKLYHVTGTVDHVDSHSVILNSNGESYEFDRSTVNLKMPSRVKPGDTITVYYSMDAKKVSADVKRDQSAGQVADPQQKPDNSDGKLKKGVIDDDRTFYGA